MDKKEYNLEQSREELDKLVNLSANQADEASCKSIAEKAKSIYEQCPESEELALRYTMALVNLSARQETVEQRLATANSIKEIFKQFKH